LRCIAVDRDLIDYGEGIGIGARDRLADNSAYHQDRNWFLFYYLLASEKPISSPSIRFLAIILEAQPLSAIRTRRAIAGSTDQQLPYFSKNEQEDILRKRMPVAIKAFL